jgi:hypothetical protein
MAKKRNERLADTVDSLRPYIERALKDEEFRGNVREALDAARGIYGDLSKTSGLTKSAAKLATDKDVHGNLQKALAELTDAVDRVQGKKGGKGRKKRKSLLLAGVIAGALYNPWTGHGTREWLLDKIAGEDDLAPLDVETPSAAAVETNGGEPVGAAQAEG